MLRVQPALFDMVSSDLLAVLVECLDRDQVVRVFLVVGRFMRVDAAIHDLDVRGTMHSFDRMLYSFA